MASTSCNLSSSASTSPPTRWDIFFMDTRYTFTDHLYTALHRTGFRTFRDDHQLRHGEVISDALLQAIQESKTYIIVFSENYASSRWCLDELVEILECYKSMGRLVLPVFYNIEPLTVRHQTGSFLEAFEKHETCFDTDRLDKWRITPTSVGRLLGYHVCKNRSEVDIINKVVDRLLLEINPMTLDVAKYPVGLDSRVKGITAFLSSDTDSVTRIGIHGMGGVGKTTLAKAVYNQNYLRFQGSSFLANVRELSGTERGLVCLQQQLVNDVLRCKNINIDNVDQGVEMIRARICSMKVLVVIDDLDSPLPLEYLGPFALGSIIIITTRNEDLLDSIKVEGRYKVNELDYSESRQLFTRHAFGNNKISKTFLELSEEILERAGGLPLALKVFGSNLINQSKEGWRWYINKLKRVSIDDLEKKLLISFDALKLVDPMLQDIFLDIACFFIGSKKEEVIQIMETYYTFVYHNIDILKKRCLLTINDRDELEMHDLLRDMGREIARNNSPNDPGKHSRLWVPKDICDVLRNDKGTNAVEGIILTDFFCKDARPGGVSFPAETFTRMSRLRFLYLKNVHLSGSFEHKFEDLRWLRWDFCPLKCLPSDFYLQKLVILAMPHSKMITLWELNRDSQVFVNLKTLNLSSSQDLITTPDFTKFPCLENLNLEGCKSLEEVHISIGSLVSLVSINLGGCVNLRSLPHSTCNLRALKSLNIVDCCKLKVLPINLGNIESLKTLNAGGLTISRLPESIRHLSMLVELTLSYNNYLKTLPDTICNLTALEVLNIAYCTHLEALPIELGSIDSLKELNALKLTVSKIPNSIERLSKLVALKLSNNENLETLPDSICNLRALEVLGIGGCSSLVALPIDLGNMKSLIELYAWGLTVSKLPDSIGNLSNLVELNLSNNENLITLPDTICKLRALEVLSIGNCTSLETLPVDLGNLLSLKELNAWGLTVSTLPDSIGRLSQLVELNLSNNKNLQSLPETTCNLRALKNLDLRYCRHLLSIAELPPNLKRITAYGCTSMESLPDLSNLKLLEILNLTYCSSLTEIQGLEELTSLRELRLRGCNPPFLEYIFTERFFQEYSRFGHIVKIYTLTFPEWISQSSNAGSTVSSYLQPNVSHNFLGVILCISWTNSVNNNYSVKTTTSDFLWSDDWLYSVVYNYYQESYMVLVPRSIFLVTDGDDRIELTAEKAEIYGIHLLYKTESTMTEEYGSTTVEVEDERYPIKRLKGATPDK